VRRALAALLLLRVLGAAQVPAPDALPAMPPTRLGLETLAHSPVVAVTVVIAVRPSGPGTDLVRVRVVERMRGAGLAAGDELSLLVSQGSLRFGSEDLLFLRPWRDGGRHELVQRVAASVPHWEERLSIVRRTLWLLEVPDPQRRVDATLDLLLELLSSEREWSRGYALAELRWMAGAQRALFTPERVARLRAAGRVSRLPDVRAGVDSVTSLLTSPPARAPSADGTEHSRP
jgi:hypothetical protein